MIVKNKFADMSDPLFIKTYLLLIATFFISIALWVAFFTQVSEAWGGVIILAALILFGLYFIFVGLFANNIYAESIAKKTGNHEVLFLVVALAGIISSVIRRVQHKQ